MERGNGVQGFQLLGNRSLLISIKFCRMLLKDEVVSEYTFALCDLLDFKHTVELSSTLSVPEGNPIS